MQYLIETYGAEEFLNSNFDGNEKISKLANAIRNKFIYGKEEPTEYDILQRRRIAEIYGISQANGGMDRGGRESSRREGDIFLRSGRYGESGGIQRNAETQYGSSEEEDAREIRNREGDESYRDDTMYRIREDAAPKNTGIGYKVFVLKNGELYPPMVANPNGESTPVGIWLDADAAPIAGQSKTGRNQVKAGGKGTQGGSGKLAYRPGWHLGEIPYALQFNRIDENGERTLFPANFVWAEVEYANDVDYQEEAMSYGYNQNGKFQHSYAGLPRVPENGAYHYRTNPNPETEPWIITPFIQCK